MSSDMRERDADHSPSTEVLPDQRALLGIPNAAAELRSLDPRYIPAESIGWWILTGALSLGGLIAIVVFSLAGKLSGFMIFSLFVAWTILTGGLIILTLVWPHVSYRHISYAMSAIGLEIRRGVFWREIVNVPQSRVQHTDVTQGPIERRFGLATLTIHTAGTQDASVSLSGLAHATALELRDALIRGGADDAV